MIDFTNCKRYKKAYNGANGNKLCIEYNGERYMLKFPSTPTKKTELSYTNGCISEYISCHIYAMLGIDVQETILGTYIQNEKEKIVVACKDFTDYGITLQDFGSLKNQIIDSTNNGYGTELTSILEAIESQQQMDQFTVLTRFWDMFAVDALLGNFDRHNGNWGFLYDQKADEITLAPVYDCGSCLLPQTDKFMIQSMLASPQERNTRIYNYPTSAIKQDNKKINYYTFLTTTEDVHCLNAIIRVKEKFDMDKISAFIDKTEYIDDLQKQFYKTYLYERYEKIIVPAYTRAIGLQLNSRERNDGNFDDLE